MLLALSVAAGYLAGAPSRAATSRGVTMAAASPLSLTFKPVPAADADAAFAVEDSSYPADEAATLEKLKLRLREASEYFWGAYDASGNLKGFVCGTLTSATKLTDESMSTHEPSGTTLCIHSVVTEASCRRQGVGSWMMREYNTRVTEAAYVKRVLLICKQGLVGFYETAGYTNLGDSGVEHGQDPWLLMERVLDGRA